MNLSQAGKVTSPLQPHTGIFQRQARALGICSCLHPHRAGPASLVNLDCPWHCKQSLSSFLQHQLGEPHAEICLGARLYSVLGINETPRFQDF